MTLMQIVPPGTVVYEPDAINRVTLQFATANDAIVFFEWLVSWGSATPVEEKGVDA